MNAFQIDKIASILTTSSKKSPTSKVGDELRPHPRLTKSEEYVMMKSVE